MNDTTQEEANTQPQASTQEPVAVVTVTPSSNGEDFELLVPLDEGKHYLCLCPPQSASFRPLDHAAWCKTLIAALKKLSFAAQTTGGTAGHDAGLQEAIAEAEHAMSFGGGFLDACAAPQPQAAPQEPVAELQHCRDGVWVHLHCGGEHVSINLSADEFTRKFALEYAKHQSQNAVLHPLYAAPQPQAVPQDICTRSHPHENMDAFCERLTKDARTINRLANEVATLKTTSAPVAWAIRGQNGMIQELLSFRPTGTQADEKCGYYDDEDSGWAKYGPHYVAPLYASPPPSAQDKRDAELLQWARNEMQRMHECEADEADVRKCMEALDAAIAAPHPQAPSATSDDVRAELDSWKEATANMKCVMLEAQARADEAQTRIADMRVEWGAEMLAVNKEHREKIGILRDVLYRNGFVECDIAACNCGSWHARYGLKERFDEICEALREADVLNNETGNLPIRAIDKLVKRASAAQSQAAAMAGMLEEALEAIAEHHVAEAGGSCIS